MGFSSLAMEFSFDESSSMLDSQTIEVEWLDVLERLFTVEPYDPRKNEIFSRADKTAQIWAYYTATMGYVSIVQKIIECIEHVISNPVNDDTKTNLQLLRNQCHNACTSILANTPPSPWSVQYDKCLTLRRESMENFNIIATTARKRHLKTDSQILRMIEIVQKEKPHLFEEELMAKLRSAEDKCRSLGELHNNKTAELAAISAKINQEEKRLKHLRTECNKLETRIEKRRQAYEEAYECALKEIEENCAPLETDIIEIKCGDVYDYLKDGLNTSVTTIVEQKLATMRGNNPDDWPKLTISIGVADHSGGLFNSDRVSLLVSVSVQELAAPCVMRIADQKISSSGKLLSDGLSIHLGSCLPKMLVSAKKELERRKIMREEAHREATTRCRVNETL